jgi:DNA (cytosine-5)-methyltransferase 1
LPDFDCLVGGFPCQAFSLSGKRQGFNDERGALFFDIVRILRCKRPRLFVLENVKGLLSHDDGRTFKTIIATLAELGYSVEWQVLNSQTFGLPQSRERVIIIGHIGELGGRQVLPIHADTATYGGPTRSETGGQVRGIADAGAGIRVPEATKTGYTIAHRGDSVNLAYLGAKNKRGRVGKGFAHTLTASNMSQYTPVLDGDGKLALRRFTPTECERLQGFPDSWTAYGKDGKVMSDTQRYKLCGNAVTTNVIQAVFERLL